MPLLPLLFDRMIDAAVMSFVLLALGSLTILSCRQPVRRMRIIVVTLAGCLIAPVVSALPGIPHWSIPRWPQPTRESTGTDHSRFPEGRHERTAAGVAGVEAQRSPRRMRDVALNDSAAPSSDRLLERDPGGHAAIPTPPEMVDDDAPRSLELPSAEEALSKFDAAKSASTHKAPDPSRANNIHPSGSEAATLSASTGLNELVNAAEVQADGPSAIVETPDSTFHLPSIAAPYRAAILAFYAVGLGAIAAWWLVGLVGLLRVLAVARPAPAACRRLLREIAGSASDRVRLLVSPRAAQPFTFAWRHPVIVLPMESREIRPSNFADPIRDGSSNCVETVSR